MTVSAPPSALKSTRSTPFGVHRDGAGVAEEREPVAVCGQGDVLGDVGAVEEHRVGAVLAFDGVAAVARIPDERVVAGTHERQVVAPVSVERVVPVAAEHRLDALAAGNRVVSGAAVEAQGDRLGCEGCCRDHVVAAETVDCKRVGWLLMLNRHQSRQAGHGDTGDVSGDVDRVSAIGAR